MIIIEIIVVILVIGYFVKKRNNKSIKKTIEIQEDIEYYGKLEKLSREEQFKELSRVISEIILDSHTRHQNGVAKALAGVLQIKSFPIKYKALSKGNDYQDLMKSNKPFELLNIIEIRQDGVVKFTAIANMIKMSTYDATRLNRLNTGDDNGTLIGTTTSELIKNNQDINVVNLIKEIKKRA